MSGGKAKRKARFLTPGGRLALSGGAATGAADESLTRVVRSRPQLVWPPHDSRLYVKWLRGRMRDCMLRGFRPRAACRALRH